MERSLNAWHGVELRHLAALEAIATEGSFSAAGVRTGYSQSAISGQIATLERLVGARLVLRLRGSRNVSLTAEGQLLLEHAKVINGRLNIARAEIEKLRTEGSSALRIGTFQSVSQTLLPLLFRRLQHEAMPVVTSLREDPAIENLVDLLVGGALDVAFVLLPLSHPGIESAELMRDPWTIAVRHDHPLAALQRPLKPRDLSHVPVITVDSNRSQDFIENALRASGAQLDISTRLADFRSVLTLAAAGLGAALVPRLAVEADRQAVEQHGMRVLTLEDQPPRLIGLAWNRERGLEGVVSRFVQIALEAGTPTARRAA